MLYVFCRVSGSLAVAVTVTVVAAFRPHSQQLLSLLRNALCALLLLLLPPQTQIDIFQLNDKRWPGTHRERERERENKEKREGDREGDLQIVHGSTESTVRPVDRPQCALWCTLHIGGGFVEVSSRLSTVKWRNRSQARPGQARSGTLDKRQATCCTQRTESTDFHGHVVVVLPHAAPIAKQQQQNISLDTNAKYSNLLAAHFASWHWDRRRGKETVQGWAGRGWEGEGRGSSRVQGGARGVARTRTLKCCAFWNLMFDVWYANLGKKRQPTAKNCARS